MVPEAALEGWRGHSSGAFVLRRFPGSHSFFLEPGEGQRGFVECVAETMARVARRKPEPEPEPAPEPSVHQSQHWCVVGSFGRNPICDRLVATLKRAGRQTTELNPYTGKSLADLPAEVSGSFNNCSATIVRV